MPQHYLTLTLADWGKEKSSFSVNHGAITVGTLAGYLTQVGALRAAVDGLTLGVIQKEKLVMDETILSQDFPEDPQAQRETKVMVVYQGNTTLKKFTLEIPTFEISIANMQPNSDNVNLTAPFPEAFVIAFEALARSPDDDTESVTVLSMRHVGRNL